MKLVHLVPEGNILNFFPHHKDQLHQQHRALHNRTSFVGLGKEEGREVQTDWHQLSPSSIIVIALDFIPSRLKIWHGSSEGLRGENANPDHPLVQEANILHPILHQKVNGAFSRS